MYSQLARRAAGTIMKHSSQRVSIHVQYVPPCVYCQLSTVNVKDSVPAEAHHVHFPDQRGDSGPELLPREERWQIQLHRHGTEAFWAARQPCSVSSTPDSWGALIRACGWNCTGTQAADGPAEETEDHSVWRWHTARSASELGCRQHLSLSGISENSSAHIKSNNNPVGLSRCGQRLILFYRRAESRECKLYTWGKRCRDPKARLTHMSSASSRSLTLENKQLPLTPP